MMHPGMMNQVIGTAGLSCNLGGFQGKRTEYNESSSLDRTWKFENEYLLGDL